MDFKRALAASTVKSLILSNLIVLFLALWFNWSFLLLLVSYFWQTIIISFFHDLKVNFFNKNLLFAGKKNLSELNPEWVKIQMDQNKKNKLVNEVIKNGIIGNRYELTTYIYGFVFFIGTLILFSLIISLASSVAVNLNIQFFETPAVFWPFIFSLFIFLLNHLFSFICYLKAEKQTYAGEVAKLVARINTLAFVFVFGVMIFSFFFWFGLVLNPILIILFSALKTFFDVKAHLQEHEAELDALRY